MSLSTSPNKASKLEARTNSLTAPENAAGTMASQNLVDRKSHVAARHSGLSAGLPVAGETLDGETVDGETVLAKETGADSQLKVLGTSKSPRTTIGNEKAFQNREGHGIQKSNRSRTILIACLALIGMNALWGMSFPIMKSINLISDQHFGVIGAQASSQYQVLNASFLIAVRFTVAMAFLFVLLPGLVTKATAQEWKAGAFIGILFYLGLIFQVVGLATISASRSGFLTSLTAVYTPLMSAFILRQRLTWQIACGSLLALLGVAILSDAIPFWGASRTDFVTETATEFPLKWGDLWTTLGALFFSGQVLLVDYYGKRHESTRLTAGMFSTAAVLAWGLVVLMVLTAPWTHGFSGFAAMGISEHIALTGSEAVALENSATALPNFAKLFELLLHPVFMVLILQLALFGSVVTFVGMNKFQPRLTAGQASVIYSTEPVFASLWAMVIPGMIAAFVATGYANETFTWQLVIGGLLILLANIVALIPSRRPSRTTSHLGT